MKILVVDDEPDTIHLFKQNFRREEKSGKILFEFALSAEQALKLLQKDEHCDVMLILSDINMPGLSGLELLGIVKKRYPAIKVFMVTAYDDVEKQRVAREHGSDDYFTKPIDFELLKEKILETKNS